METFALRDVETILGIRRPFVTRLIREGFVTPSRGARREYRFTFQDIIVLRTANTLVRAQVAPRAIVRSLKRLRAALPGELPLTGLRITAFNNKVVVAERDGKWEAQSGQRLLDFDVAPERNSIRLFPGRADEAPERPATQWLEDALALESSDHGQAVAAYRKALQLDPRLAEAYLNLGVLLAEMRQPGEAEAVYRAGIANCPEHADLHFNLGVLLEDLLRRDEALRAYERALTRDANFADAHFNAARLHEAAGNARQAIRHYNAYRRLQGRSR